MTQNKPYNLYFSLLQFAYFAAAVSIATFWVVFLEERGFSNLEIGSILALLNFLGIFSQPLLGILVQKTRSYTKPVGISLLVGMACMLIFPSPFLRQSALVVLLIGYAISFRSVGAVVESWVVSASQNNARVDYGLSRAFGSVGSIVAALLAGYLISAFGLSVVFYQFALFSAFSIVAVFLLGNDSFSFAPNTRTRRWSKPEISALLKNHKSYFVLCFCILLTFSAYWPTTSTYYPLLIMESGGNETQIGIAQALMSLSEVPALLFSRFLLRRWGAVPLMIFGFFANVLRIFVHIPASSSVVLLVLCPLLQGLSFGLFWSAVLHYVGRRIPDDLRTSAVIILSLCMLNISNILGNMIFGVLVEANGILFGYWAGTILALFSAVLAFVYFIVIKKDGRIPS